MKKHALRSVAALCLMLAVLVTAFCPAALAAEVSAEAQAARQEDLDYLYETLKSEHPNLFANTPEADFVARKAEIEARLSAESDLFFAFDCASLAALAKDSHTTVSLGQSAGEVHYCLFDMDYYCDKWILSGALKEYSGSIGNEVVSINGLSIDEVMQRFSLFLSADNSVKLRSSYWQMCYIYEAYVYLGIAKDGEPLTIVLKDAAGQQNTMTAAAMTYDEMSSSDFVTMKSMRTRAAATDYDKSKTYFSLPLSESVYYIQYNQCRQDKNLPMKDFAAQVSADLSKGGYKLILVDMRNNGGGSDGVISPLLEVMMEQRELGVQVAALIGTKTFSSAIINSVEMQEMGFVLAGEPTSGSIDHFGAVNSFKLPNSGLGLGISSKFISMSEYFEAGLGKGVESLQPDVYLPQTAADYLTGKDSCVEAILADPSILVSADSSSLPLSRGRMVGMLYQQAGSPAQPLKTELPFEDMFGFEWYANALCWAKTQKIAMGSSASSFSSARAITWQEAAVFLARTAQAQGLALKETRTAQLPAALSTAPWNENEVKLAWSSGLLPEDADFSAAPTRAQGAAMASALFAK